MRCFFSSGTRAATNQCVDLIYLGKVFVSGSKVKNKFKSALSLVADRLALEKM